MDNFINFLVHGVFGPHIQSAGYCAGELRGVIEHLGRAAGIL